MKMFNNIFLSFLFVASLVFLPACSNADADQTRNTDRYIVKAKKATQKFKLTKIPLSCLYFEKLESKYDGKVMVDVREKHGGKCAGDPDVSPRLFSLGFEESSGDIWSDAKSLLGQLEKLN